MHVNFMCSLLTSQAVDRVSGNPLLLTEGNRRMIIIKSTTNNIDSGQFSHTTHYYIIIQPPDWTSHTPKRLDSGRILLRESGLGDMHIPAYIMIINIALY